MGRWRSMGSLFYFAIVVFLANANPTTSTTSDLACFDDEVSECQARRDECETDPAWMLRHCRATCGVCVPENHLLQYDPGLGKIPDDVVTEVLLVIRGIHRFALEMQMDPEFALSQSLCHDQNELCAFWTFQEQCSNPDFISFMKRQCPLSCQLCGTDELKGLAFLEFLMVQLAKAYSDADNVIESRRRALSLLLKTLHMDPAQVGTPPSSNWVLTLHERLMNLVPSVLLRVYQTSRGPVDPDERQLLGTILGSPSLLEEAPHQALIAYRSRGFIVQAMQDFDHLITRSIELSVGFAVPNDAAIATIQEVSPIVQIGAGSGYWAAILRNTGGVDIVAYDLHPPNASSENAFFDYTYTNDVQQGSCIEVFRDSPHLAQRRTLLLVWPNDPDPGDNQQFCVNGGCEGSQATWDAECLLAFLEAGGRKLVFVGEREDIIAGGNECGMSATRRFQHLLAQHFRLVKTVVIPRWWLNQDDLTVWELDGSDDSPHDEL